MEYNDIEYYGIKMSGRHNVASKIMTSFIRENVIHQNFVVALFPFCQIHRHWNRIEIQLQTGKVKG